MNTYIISDSHFGHANIIKYENRPFKDIKEMEEVMIKKWNKVVKNGDIVYHLGDFNFGSFANVSMILKKLNGRIRLVMGNHDRGSTNKFRDAGFEEVYQHSIILNEFYILSHKPCYMTENSPYRNIHGHIHGKTLDDNLYYNASVEVIDYTPVKFDDIKKSFISKIM